MHRTRILLLFGGESPEHEVSIASARNVYAALDDRKYDILLGYITKQGHWHLVDDIETLEGTHKNLLPVPGGKHFLVEPGGHSVVPDVILPILHGGTGEDGALQGLAKMTHIPIVGCDILGSAICMDKEVAKRLLRAANLPVADYILHRKHQLLPAFSHVTLELGNPVFVKPASAGSSVGVRHVYNETQFANAITEALKYDHKVLIEQAMAGREIECAVLGNEKPEASGLGEIKPSDAEGFYSYDAKYSATSQTELIIPADLPEDITAKVREIALSAYRALECRGLARVDFFVANDGSITINEINTLPGFTNISMYPKLWRAAGLSYAGLIDKLISFALEK
ncbi:MAG TPA: D-alanine--D-alanine ligase family protein [Candidatus Saccharimonadales bacterium]|nr:D-alanine--D-alanine ligase family protein [Candidatus Saccharimonadales bacterium]